MNKQLYIAFFLVPHIWRRINELHRRIRGQIISNYLFLGEKRSKTQFWRKYSKQHLDLYTDYLLSAFGQATATGLAMKMDGEISHEKITRFLSEDDYTSKDLWLQVKPTVRKIERDEGRYTDIR